MSSRQVLLLKNKTTPVDPYDEEFVDHGFSPLFIPLLDHIHLDKMSIATFLQGNNFINNTSSFIITSQRAVEVLNETMELIEDTRMRSLIFSKPAYTVGPATAKILSAAGFEDIRGGSDAGNGKILSDIIINDEFHKDKMDQEIVFFTGEIRKDIIPRNLLKNNFKLTERVIYKTATKEGVIERFHQITSSCLNDENWIVFFSPQGTEQIVKYIPSLLRKFKIAAIGPTTEAYLVENNIIPDIVLKKPDANSLTESISSF